MESTADAESLDPHQQALAWLVTMWSGEASAKDHQALTAWRNASEAHEHAWQAVSTMDQRLRDVPAGTATVSLYRLERDNIKVTDPLTNRVVPVGKQRSDGLELTFNADLSQGWKMMAGYAYTDATIIESVAVDRSVNLPGGTVASSIPFLGKRATLTARNTGNVWMTKELGYGIKAGGGVNAVGSRYANPGNTVQLAGYVTADAMLAYEARHYEVQLNINNLGDTRYVVSGHGTSPNLSLPGAPRGVALTLRYRL